jgi:hypothetical protein
LFWHRRGNTPASLTGARAEAARQVRLGGRPAAVGVELDLKWTGPSGAPSLYAYHGPTGRERLGLDRLARAVEAGRVAAIDQLLEAPGAEALYYLVELKCGHGPPEAALARLHAIVAGRGLEARVWLAASSLLLLEAARRSAPGLPRVLFAAPWGRERLAHKPTTYTAASLLRHGLFPRADPAVVDVLCPIGLRPRSLEAHARLAEAAAGRGLGYLPGRVTTQEALAGLARAGHDAAFVYMEPGVGPRG